MVSPRNSMLVFTSFYVSLRKFVQHVIFYFMLPFFLCRAGILSGRSEAKLKGNILPEYESVVNRK